MRCSELRSLHLGDVITQAPVFSQKDLDHFLARQLYSEVELLRLKAMRREVIHPDAKKAVQLLNKRGNIQKIYLDVRPSEALEYLKICTQVPGLERSEIAFASPTRWSVLKSSTTWGPGSWFRTFLEDQIGKPLEELRYLPYWFVFL